MSLILAVGSTVISLVLGVAAAYALIRQDAAGQRRPSPPLLMAPLIMPSVVIGVALLQYSTA